MQNILQFFKTFPEYIPAAISAGTVVLSALPLYLGLHYLLHRRSLKMPLHLHIGFFGVCGIGAVLAFASVAPQSNVFPPVVFRSGLFLVCLFLAYFLVTLIDTFLIDYYLVRRSHIYISPLLRRIVQYSIFIVFLLIILERVLRFNPFALFAIPTILTAGFALALQDTFKTFIAGLSLSKTLRLGDTIDFQGVMGDVVDINWARTTIRTNGLDYYFIPNTLLQVNSFTNYSYGDPGTGMKLVVGVSYDCAPAKVKKVLQGCFVGLQGLAKEPQPWVQLTEFANSSMTYTLYYAVTSVADRLQIHDQLATRVWTALDRAGMQIPYPQHVLHIQRPKPTEPTEKAPVPEKILSALGHWELAQVFSKEDLEELGRWVHIRTYAAGDIIFKQGEEGDSLFLIMDGFVDIINGTDHQGSVIAVLGNHQVFGEMSLLTGAPRSMTVRAQSRLDVLEIAKSGMQRILMKRPTLSEKLAQVVAERQKAEPMVDSHSGSLSANADMADTLLERIKHFFDL